VPDFLQERGRADVVEIKQHMAALTSDGRLLLDAVKAAGLDAAVPTCPGWRVRDLLAHVHYVHGWATAYIGDALTEMVPEPQEAELLAGAPADDVLLARFEEGHAALVEALTSAPSDLRCWTFLPASSPLVMWARRQAHETAIHRVDAELAAGRSPTAFDAEFAADGVDELLLGFLGRAQLSTNEDAVLGTIGLEARDRPERWSVRLRTNSVETTRGITDCELRVRATAADLYLVLWNRPPSSEPDLIGAAELFDVWRDRIRVTWS
jgi:uncharacterized protein (TIGR03083 family)